MMMKRWRAAALALLCLALFAAAGCVRIPKRDTATVLADSALQTALRAMQPGLEARTGVSVTFLFADTDTLAQDIRDGEGGDLAVLAGVSATARGSNTFGAPAAVSLIKAQLADNYTNLTMDSDGRVYSLLKPLKSENFAAAQAVVDDLLSQTGKQALADYGFTI